MKTYLMTALLLGGSLSDAPAQAMAHFADGFGAQPDGYPGAKGDGWLGPWEAVGTVNNEERRVIRSTDKEASTTEFDTAVEIAEHDPLEPTGGKHIRLCTGKGFNDLSVFTISRRAEGVTEKPHQVKFQLRIDALNGSYQRRPGGVMIRIAGTDGKISDAGTAPRNTSWRIQGLPSGTSGEEVPAAGHGAIAGRWNFGTGEGDGETQFIPSTMELRPEVVYSFTIKVNPQESVYSVSISDGKETVEVENLSFKNTGIKPPDYLSFGSVTARALGQAYSIDNVGITPLP